MILLDGARHFKTISRAVSCILIFLRVIYQRLYFRSFGHAGKDEVRSCCDLCCLRLQFRYKNYLVRFRKGFLTFGFTRNTIFGLLGESAVSDQPLNLDLCRCWDVPVWKQRGAVSLFTLEVL